MSKPKRRSFTDEFKRDAVKLVTERGYLLAEAARDLAARDLAARDLGVHANMLQKWK